MYVYMYVYTHIYKYICTKLPLCNEPDKLFSMVDTLFAPVCFSGSRKKKALVI